MFERRYGVGRYRHRELPGTVSVDGELTATKFLFFFLFLDSVAAFEVRLSPVHRFSRLLGSPDGLRGFFRCAVGTNQLMLGQGNAWVVASSSPRTEPLRCLHLPATVHNSIRNITTAALGRFTTSIFVKRKTLLINGDRGRTQAERLNHSAHCRRHGRRGLFIGRLGRQLKECR